MLHRKNLGNTGLSVPLLGFGSSSFRNGTPSEGAQLLEQAVELGIDYYDTARSYSNGEEAVGCLPKHIRKKIIVATKTGARGGMICVKDLHKSLATLRRDHIDIWMTHMIETEYEYELCLALGGFCDIAAASRKAGIVRATGASFHAPTSLILRAIEEQAFDVVMFQLNIIGRETVFGSSIASYRDILLPAAIANGVGVVAMKVLAGGELRHGASQLLFLADDSVGRNVTGGAIRWAAMHPGVSTAVVGMSSTEELVSNFNAVMDLTGEDESLAKKWVKRVEEISTSDCIRCGSCQGICPQGIEIPKVMRLYDQLICLG
ncbi:MAG: hypothetical protein GY845_21535, partial [Planctomycetes bacterium]|nr:hypothetical protein [Planctomycetota bacterium]